MNACDLFIIGAGSGGIRAARLAGAKGARVAVAEQSEPGGTCVNAGCIPKKLYSYAAHYADAFAEAPGYGWAAVHSRLDWELLKSRRREEVSRLNGIYRGLLSGSGATLIRGAARVVDGHTVEIGGQRWHAGAILVATGARADVPRIEGIAHAASSDQVFDLARFPARLGVVGGGYIACEFASIFQGLGSRVTQFVRGNRILQGFDEEACGFLRGEMHGKGIRQQFGCEVSRISRQDGALRAATACGLDIDLDAILFATGRSPNTHGLGLEQAGVRLGSRQEVLVDEDYRSSIRSIYAIGDVSSRAQLTPVALAEGAQVVHRLFGGPTRAGSTIRWCRQPCSPPRRCRPSAWRSRRQGLGSRRSKSSPAASGR